MSESDSEKNVNSTPCNVAGSGLPHVESPSMVPDNGTGTPAEPLKAEMSSPEPAKVEPAPPEPAIAEPAASKPVAPLSATRSTALVLTLPRLEEAAAEAEAEPEPVPRAAKSRRFAFTPAAASLVAVVLGAAIGSGATAGLLYLNATPAAMPADPATFTAALGRIDRELAAMKTSIEGSAKLSNTQIAKIADRMDRAEKSQADASAKLARTTDALDRLDHRLAANAAGDITGSLPSATLAPGPGDRTAALSDPKRAGTPAPTAILDGWVLRDVFNGAAMVQTPRNGILEVVPGDVLPGLGRIEGVKRQDGRWVVVTSRGLIVSH
jgi:hypothetical protein